MKTNFTTNTKDNLFGVVVMASLFLFIACIAAVANSQTVVANANADMAPVQMVSAQMEIIVVSAQRMPLKTMDTVVVSASRHDVLLASK